MPLKDATPTENAKRSSSPVSQTYTVVKGDYLWKIAQKFYGKDVDYTKIYGANKGAIRSNPNLIYARQALTIPQIKEIQNMNIDLGQIQYYVELLTEIGKTYELDTTIQSFAWEEHEGQLSQKTSLTLFSHSTEASLDIQSLLTLNVAIRIYADWSEEKSKYLRGQFGGGNTTIPQNKSNLSLPMTR